MITPGAITSVDGLAAALARWHDLQECLLVEVRLTEHLYTAELVFDHMWESYGRVRPDLGEGQELVTVRLVGVEELRFVGALNDVQRDRPDEIDWGMSEVALVRAVERDGLLGIEVRWESERRIEAAFVSADVRP